MGEGRGETQHLLQTISTSRWSPESICSVPPPPPPWHSRFTWVNHRAAVIAPLSAAAPRCTQRANRTSQFCRYQQILKYHMDHNEHLHVIETCKKFG